MSEERVYLTGREYGALQSVFGFVSAWEIAKGRLAKRVEMAGLTKEWDQVMELSSKILDGVLRTIPINKLAHVREELLHVAVYIKTEAPGIRTNHSTQFAYLPVQTLNDLLNYVIRQECVLCEMDASEAKKCPFRKLIESALPHTVGKDHSTEHCMYSDMVIGLGVEEE